MANKNTACSLGRGSAKFGKSSAKFGSSAILSVKSTPVRTEPNSTELFCFWLDAGRAESNHSFDKVRDHWLLARLSSGGITAWQIGKLQTARSCSLARSANLSVKEGIRASANRAQPSATELVVRQVFGYAVQEFGASSPVLIVAWVFDVFGSCSAVVRKVVDFELKIAEFCSAGVRLVFGCRAPSFGSRAASFGNRSILSLKSCSFVRHRSVRVQHRSVGVRLTWRRVQSEMDRFGVRSVFHHDGMKNGGLACN